MNTTTLTTSITIPQVDLSLLEDLAKKFGWIINSSAKKSGLDEALDDIKTGKVYYASSAQDLIRQCLE